MSDQPVEGMQDAQFDIKKAKSKFYTPPGLDPEGFWGSGTVTPPKPKKEPPLPYLTPITEEEWVVMDGKARWDSTVALRGPDLVGSEGVKWFSSSVIRHKLSGIMRVGGTINRHLPFVVIPDRPPGREKFGSFDARHFCEHVMEAAHWLGIPIATVPMKVWADAMMSGLQNPHLAMTFAKALGEPYRSCVVAYLVNQYSLTEEQIFPKEEGSSCE